MKNKKGKKLVVLGAMAALLTLIGVSGSQTYAKYVEEANVTTQQATVAKWGYVFTANAAELFDKAHEKNLNSNLSTRISDDSADGTSIVVSASSENIVAPGVAGSMVFGVHGKSEVYSQLTITLNNEDEVSLTKTATSEVYRPILWTLEKANDSYTSFSPVSFDHDSDNATPDLELTNVDTLDTIASYLSTISTAKTPGLEINEDYRLSYSWPFYVSEDNDILDTYLGEFANGDPVDGYTANTNLALSLVVRVEQIQVA